jgi:poly(hydroxyalkanoate) granule-associated protein
MDKPEGSKEKWGLGDTFERVWSQALLAVSAAEDEASKVAHRVAEVAGWSQEEVKRQVRELTDRLVSQRREMEKALEDGVKRTLVKLKVPRREEIQAVQERLEKLAQRIEELASKQ